MPSSIEDAQVPPDFPQEFLGSVAGAQAKLLVRRTSEGRYVDSAESQRFDRWAVCVDLREQLIEYTNKKLAERGQSMELLLVKICQALELKRGSWGSSTAEAAWITGELQKHFSGK